MKQEALHAVYSIRRLSNMSRNQQGSCVVQIHLEIPPSALGLEEGQIEKASMFDGMDMRCTMALSM
jgi:hypothetical protein